MELRIKDGILEKYNGQGGTVTVPAGVRELAEDAFCGTDVACVILPAGLLSIGERAFKDCASLKTVVLPEGLEEISHHAFCGCSALTEVRIPGSVRRWGQYIFSECKALCRVTLSEGLERIPLLFLHKCHAIEEITVPKSVREIENSAFYDCASLRTLTVSDVSVSFTGGAFSRGPGICVLQGPEALAEMDFSWWYSRFSRRGLDLISIPWAKKNESLRGYLAHRTEDAVERILHEGMPELIPMLLSVVDEIPLPLIERMEASAEAAGRTDALAALTQYRAEKYPPQMIAEMEEARTMRALGLLPITEAELGESFSFRRSLLRGEITLLRYLGEETSVYLPKETEEYRIAHVSGMAFSNSAQITAFCVDADHGFFSVRDGVLYSADGTRLIAYPRGLEATEFTVPEGVLEIGEYAFARNTRLERVHLPRSLRVIGDYAFMRNTALAAILLPEGLEAIGNDAFAVCERLTSVCIPDGTVSLGERVFWQCRALEEAHLGQGVRVLRHWAFASCDSLRLVTLGTGLETLCWSAFAFAPSAVTVRYAGERTAWEQVEQIDNARYAVVCRE